VIDARAVRLALFTDTWAPQVNGVVRTLERLRAAVLARGGAIEVFTSAPDDGGGDDDADASAPVAGVHRFSSVKFWAYEELRLAWPSAEQVESRTRVFAPTIVHAATEFGLGLAGRAASRRLRIPFVSSYHTNLTAYARYYRLGALATPGWSYLRWFHNSGARTWCPSEAIREDVAAHGFLNTRVWSRGVDATRFHPRFRSAALRAQWGADDDTLVVLYVGRLAAEKGLDVGVPALREAFRQVTEATGKRCVFVAVGDGPYAATVRAQAPDGSMLPGALTGEALSAAYASGDLFLFPSVTDTFGNVMLEAMASGLPVVGAHVGPTRELIGEGAGWTVASQDVDAYVAGLRDALVNDADRARRSAWALAEARRRDWESIWDGLIGEYLQVQTSGPTDASVLFPTAHASPSRPTLH
jgi:glycosyltransferase involved in cell wall biosynthesis